MYASSRFALTMPTGRRARLVELDPVYVDRIVRRWQDYARDDAILAGTDRRFEDIVTERRGSEERKPADVPA